MINSRFIRNNWWERAQEMNFHYWFTPWKRYPAWSGSANSRLFFKSRVKMDRPGNRINTTASCWTVDHSLHHRPIQRVSSPTLIFVSTLKVSFDCGRVQSSGIKIVSSSSRLFLNSISCKRKFTGHQAIIRLQGGQKEMKKAKLARKRRLFVTWTDVT